MKLSVIFTLAVVTVANAHVLKRQDIELKLNTAQQSLLDAYFQRLATEHKVDFLTVVDAFDVAEALEPAKAAVAQILPIATSSDPDAGTTAFADVTCTRETPKCEACLADIQKSSDEILGVMIAATVACITETFFGFSLLCVPGYFGAVVDGIRVMTNFCTQENQAYPCEETCSWIP